MRLSKDYQYQILCEDAQMRSFILGVLSHQGINARKIRVKNYPCGDGCGEAFVKREFPKEVKILRSTGYNKKVLIVCTDADNLSVNERKRILMTGLEDEQSCRDLSGEQIIIWIPKREIETWIRFLRGEDVDIEKSYRHSGNPVRCREETKVFSLYCQGIKDIDCKNVRSLEDAKAEYTRVCELQRERS